MAYIVMAGKGGGGVLGRRGHRRGGDNAHAAMAYIVMTYVVMVQYSFGLYSYGL